MTMASPSDLTSAQKQAELDAVLAAGLFGEQTNLRALLAYLGRKAVEDGGQPIKEYTIGVEALGKAGDYDPRIDPTVRVAIGRLRTKLSEYYDSPAATGPIRIELPKGQYQLVFSSRRHAAGLPPARARWVRTLAPVLAALAAGIVLGALVPFFPPAGPRAARASLPPGLRAFWRPHLESGRPTLIVYGTPLFIKLDRWLLRDSRVNRWEDVPRAEGLPAFLGAVPETDPRPSYDYTGIGEAEAVFSITRLLASQGTSLSVKRSATINWDDFRDTDLVLVGSHKFNRQLTELPYELKYLPMSRPSRIVNMRPGPGELSQYATVFTQGTEVMTEEYAVVSSLAGISPNTHLTVVSAPSSEGTAAAAEFVTRADTLQQLYARLPGGGSGPPAAAFQVVVRARMKDGIPVQLEYVTHHVLGR